MRRTPANPTHQFTLPEHIPLSQHVGQIMVLGQFPNQQRIEVTYINKKTRQLHYKILTKN